MSEISQPFFFYTNTNPATNSPRILIYAMPNPDYHKIDLKAP